MHLFFHKVSESTLDKPILTPKNFMREPPELDYVRGKVLSY